MTASRGGLAYELEFAVDAGGRSFLGRQFARYPVHLCRGLHLDEAAPGACSVALQSVSGGLFEADVIDGRVIARARSLARVSTAASTIVHTMRGGRAEQSIALQAAEGAFLEYRPEPLILFPGSRLRSSVAVQAAAGAVVVFGESFSAHDPAGGARPFAELDARVELRRGDGRLLARERMLLAGEAWRQRLVGISGRHAVHGALWVVREGDNGALLRALRDALDAAAVYGGASELPHRAGLQARFLSGDAVSAGRAMALLQAQVRLHLLADRGTAGSPAQSPAPTAASAAAASPGPTAWAPDRTAISAARERA